MLLLKPAYPQTKGNYRQLTQQRPDIERKSCKPGLRRTWVVLIYQPWWRQPCKQEQQLVDRFLLLTLPR
jgi:hypothetical protein